MNYRIQRMDGRYSYNQHFQYFASFNTSMTRGLGPLHFNLALQWMITTWGWSSEVRQYGDILQWVKNMSVLPLSTVKGSGLWEVYDTSMICNPHWSWTNQHRDLRIYMASDRELMVFQLAHPVDQK